MKFKVSILIYFFLITNIFANSLENKFIGNWTTQIINKIELNDDSYLIQKTEEKVMYLINNKEKSFMTITIYLNNNKNLISTYKVISDLNWKIENRTLINKIIKSSVVETQNKEAKVIIEKTPNLKILMPALHTEFKKAFTNGKKYTSKIISINKDKIIITDSGITAELIRE